MKKDCLDIGIIQAFLDGELAHDQSARVSGHIAACDACALMLANAEDESAVVFPALEREFNTLVPTQRLWNKINAEIETERENARFWTKAWAFISVSLMNPSFAAAAGLLIVFGLVSVVWMSRTSPVGDKVASGPSTISKPASTGGSPPAERVISNEPAPAAIRTSAPVRADRLIPMAAVITERRPNIGNSSTAAAILPGEESYVRTIASLSKTVETQKDTVLRPGERIAYERDMALVNDAITKMRAEVRRDPKNDSAKQVLYSSYQNKIDLLNSVSQKEELLVSLK
ncbi:MAG: zf-HC2 domain-containing protein [Pyrinomonadaceae bacterium]|nr:zf-HC2 domain-containing protein [Acidobacteriota bacterium]MBK7932051.1 zf-HC2 domain-containing protein [Acidobacteriota bacterium]MBP7375795.1 zf-HC2 domain-containing protein [Pyrinomonadaceae bacterium]